MHATLSEYGRRMEHAHRPLQMLGKFFRYNRPIFVQPLVLPLHRGGVVPEIGLLPMPECGTQINSLQVWLQRCGTTAHSILCRFWAAVLDLLLESDSSNAFLF